MATPYTIYPDLPDIVTPVLSETAYKTHIFYSLVTDYAWRPGILPMDVAGPEGTPPVLIKTHATRNMKTVAWAAVAVNGQPQCPAPFTLQPNDVLISQDNGGSCPGRLPDGTAITCQWGTYTYVCMVPNPQTGPLFFGDPPITNPGQPENTLKQSDFNQGLTGAAPAPPAFTTWKTIGP